MADNDKAITEVTQHNEEARAPKDVMTEAAAKGQGVTGYESLTPWQTIMTFKMNSLVCFFAALSAATDGYQIGLVGNIIANPGFVKQFGTDRDADGNIVLASGVIGAWNAVGSVGQIIGMVGLTFVTARFGRKIAMYTYWFILALSVALECAAREWRLWLVAKIFTGIGVGCLQSTIPSYISEIARPRVRGALLMCYSLWWITGQFFAPVALQVLSKTQPDNYIIPVYTQWSQIGLMLIIYLLLPESPAWCASKGKAEQGKKALRFIYRGVDGFDIDREYDQMVATCEHERAVALEQKNTSWWAIFKGTNGMRTLVSCWTLVTQMFIGLGVFFTYGSYFFQQAGVDDPFKVTCITSGINIAASIAVIYLADVAGRRYLACVGTSICLLCNVAVGILGVVRQSGSTNILLIVFSCFWNIGLVANGATGWGYIGEISSQRLRPYTSGFAAASSCVIGVVLGYLIPYMVNANEWNWGLKTCWFFFGMGLPFTVAMWFLIPETSGRSSAELDELFERKIRPFRFHKTKTTAQLAYEAQSTSSS